MGENQEQQDFWSSQAGEKWVQHQRDMDALLAPVLQLVLDHADLKAGETVMDIGCGAGTSTAKAAKLVGENGHCTGVDIADTLLDHCAASPQAALRTQPSSPPFQPR